MGFKRKFIGKLPLQAGLTIRHIPSCRQTMHNNSHTYARTTEFRVQIKNLACPIKQALSQSSSSYAVCPAEKVLGGFKRTAYLLTDDFRTVLSSDCTRIPNLPLFDDGQSPKRAPESLPVGLWAPQQGSEEELEASPSPDAGYRVYGRPGQSYFSAEVFCLSADRREVPLTDGV